MGHFSQFVTFSTLKVDVGVVVRILKKQICNYMLKVSVHFYWLTTHLFFYNWARAFQIIKTSI